MRIGRPSATRARRLAPAALVVSITATALAVITDGQVSNPVHVTIVAVACSGYLGMLAADRRFGGLTLPLVVGATAASVVVAVLVVPRFTGDLWSYAMYGRILGVHHANPWIRPPAAFHHDPILSLVGRTWRHTPSVYGPAFTGLSAVSAWILGSGALLTRLSYQILAALVLGAGSWCIWRRTRSAAAVAFLTVHPVVAMYLVNGGRNDILVGVALLAAVVLVSEDRPVAAGIAAGFGALVKVVGVVGLAALVVTMIARGDRRAARRTALSAAAVFGVAYARPGLQALLAPMQTAGALYSRDSPWSVLTDVNVQRPSTHVALAVLAILVLTVIFRHARGNPATGVTASLGMLAMAAAYTLSGYLAWALPTAALDHRSRVSRIVAFGGVGSVVTYEILRHPFPGLAGIELWNAALVTGPALLVALVVALVCTSSPRSARATEEMPTMTVTHLAERTASNVGSFRTLVVLPTLDEADNIRTVLRRTRAALPAAHVLVVDDGSLDGTPALAEALDAELGQIRVLRRTGPRGLGPAYRAGFAVALDEGFDVAMEMDADLSHDPDVLPTLLAAVAEGADLAIGSRYVPGGATPGWPFRRRLLSRAGGTYARFLLRLPVHDVTSGFRAYRTTLLRTIDLDTVTSSGYGFQIEMTDRARLGGARIVETPIVFRDRTLGKSKMSGAIAREALVMVTRRALPGGRPVARPVAPVTALVTTHASDVDTRTGAAGTESALAPAVS